MASPPFSAEKHNHVATISAATTTSNTSPSHGVDLNNPSATFDDAPSPTPITVPVASSMGSSVSATADEASGSSSGVTTKKGRGKVEMRRVEKESNLLVTFSKRRSGLFKKANELCTLCGVQCAVVVFSPAGKVFSFGHPSVDSVVDRYLTGNLINPMPQNQIEGDPDPQGADIENLTAELSDLMDAFDAAKKKSQSLDKRRAERQAKYWFEKPLQQMDLVQLDSLKQAMKDLRAKVYEQAGMPMKTSTSSSSHPSTFQLFHQNGYPNIHGAGSSNNGPSFAGFPSWSNKHESNEAGPSGLKNGGNSGDGSSGGL